MYIYNNYNEFHPENSACHRSEGSGCISHKFMSTVFSPVCSPTTICESKDIHGLLFSSSGGKFYGHGLQVNFQ